MSGLRLKLFDLFRSCLPSKEAAMGMAAVLEPHIQNLIDAERDRQARQAALREALRLVRDYRTKGVRIPGDIQPCDDLTRIVIGIEQLIDKPGGSDVI